MPKEFNAKMKNPSIFKALRPPQPKDLMLPLSGFKNWYIKQIVN